MMNRNSTAAGGRQQRERGAALIVAIAIMTILLAVGLTFFYISRQEVRSADNVKSRVQADLLIDSALAIAIAEINKNFSLHPEATSLDHAMFSRFDGSWVAGKQWALWNGIPLQDGGIPQVPMGAMPEIQFPDGAVEQLYSGARSAPWLYIPRFEDLNPYIYDPAATNLGGGSLAPAFFNLADPLRPPFVTPAFYGPSATDGFTAERYPLEWVNTWADVDNTGDGLKDAVWIPLARERYFSGGAPDTVTGLPQDNDGVDNNLNGLIDEVNEFGLEVAAFVYWGGNDGLDNDGDGTIDGPAEQKYFLTTPLPGLTIPVDLNADGIVPDFVPLGSTGNLVPLTVTLPLTITVNTTSGPVNLTAADVDVLDNDYDGLVNDYKVYAYVGPNTLANFPPYGLSGFEDTGEVYATPEGPFAIGDPVIKALESNAANSGAGAGYYSAGWLRLDQWFPGDARGFEKALLKAYHDINVDTTFGGPNNLDMFPAGSVFWSDLTGGVDSIDYNLLRPFLRITHSGEPVCELVGRAAITIRDEASKINMNVAGAHTLNPVAGDTVRALGDGLSPAEIDTRILPDIGIGLARNMWALLNGTPAGVPVGGSFALDVAYPGYGRVDDNANLLLAALDGRDTDGDGLAGEGLFLPPLNDPLFDVYYAQLGAFEGVDDPSERQRFRPLLNLQAEDRNPYNISGFVDGIDNDGDGVVNERGELGDFQLKDTLDIKLAQGIGDLRYGYMRHSISAHSTDRNANFVTGVGGIRAVNKLDFNFATPQQIAANLLLANAYQVTTSRADIFPSVTSQQAFFANGLLQGDVHTRASADGLLGGYIRRLPADGILQAMQAAVDIVDNRDAGHRRSILTTERTRLQPIQFTTGATAYDYFPRALSPRERIAERDFFPLEEIQNHLRDALDVKRKLQFNDDWWTFTANVTGVNGNPEQRKISYTVSGNEAVKINEIMVRPVRRVEAETVPVSTLPLDGSDPMDGAPNLQNFDPQGGYPQLPDFLVERRQFDGDSDPATQWTPNGDGFLGDRTWIESSGLEDVVQFRIRATDGLPPGRYYLIANIRGSIDPADAVFLEYAIKYDTAGGGADIISDLPGPPAVPFTSPDPLHFSEAIPGAPVGSVFLNGTDGVNPPTNQYFTDGGFYDGVDTRFGLPNTAQQTFTVSVSAVDDLYIAIRLSAAAPLGTTLQIDSLDFSQEPSHEWLELVNVSDEVVDIGGWEMEVGIPDRPGVPRDPFKSNWKIPRGSRIAPGGMVLLAANKFDYFRQGGGVSRIFDNGMGLADGIVTGGPLVNEVSGLLTVPRVFDDNSPTLTPGTALYDSTGSVFFRDENEPNKGLVDYVDRDGDGRSSFNFAQDTDSVGVESSVASSELGSILTTANLPWDRIIQLQANSVVTTVNPYSPNPADKTLGEIGDVNDVAAFVLRGGIFPNYPERDGIDNDGDGGYIDSAGRYVPGILDLDMVDNNLDGFIDQQAVIDPLLPVDYTLVRNSEGVDEGYGLYNNAVIGRRYGAGSYEPGTLPLLFFNDRSVYDANFTFDPLPDPTLRYIDAVPLIGGLVTELIDTYHGSDLDPLDWKVFVERRWYPGDNVIVTLYEGSASLGNVVDRVTYREYDVINRTIDDMVVPNYVDVAGVPYAMNLDYPTFWRPDHMALDFYRSLERKHPLYNGDRFGTSNRWEATDGNYDDWADSPSFFEAVLATNVPASPVQLADAAFAALPQYRLATARGEQLFLHAMYGSPLRMNLAARRSENPVDLELLAGGAPDPVQFPATFDYFRTHEDGPWAPGGTPTLTNQTWNHSRTAVRNRRYQSPGDLMTVTHQMYLHDALNTAAVPGVTDGFLRDMTMLNIGLESGVGAFPITAQDIALRGTSLGQDSSDQPGSGNLLREAINSMAQESKVFTVGQAEFRPIHPDLTPGEAQNANILNWVPNPGAGDPDDLWAPATWAPFFLFELPGDNVARSSVNFYPNYPSYDTGVNINQFVPRHYLFNANYMFGNAGPFYNPNLVDVADRWTLERRIGMYVSQNRPGPGGALRPAEGLWIWDGEDGLENGEYILYVGTFLPEMADRIETAASASVNIGGKPATPFFVANASGATTNYTLGDGTVVPMDRAAASLLRRDPTGSNPYYTGGQRFRPNYLIDVITDPTEAQGRAPLQSTVFDPSTKPPGLIHPDDWNPDIVYRANDDGYIFYGNNAVGGWRPQIVRVTDNFLALRVRNVGSEAQLGVITHIVLAPRKRTAGRLNVNTAQSRIVQRPSGGNTLHEYLSTLLGLPAVVDVGRTVVSSSGSAILPTLPLNPFADLALMSQDSSSGTFPADGSWSAPQHLYGGPALPTPPFRNLHSLDLTTDADLLVPAGVGSDAAAHRIGAFRLNAMLLAGRKEHADGRYYESVGDLVLDSSAYDYEYAISRADIPNRSALTFSGVTYPAGVENSAIYPLSNEPLPPRRFDETYARFRRLANIVTTRSDVYEITMTVEVGYGVDRNSDGIINYRDPDEFVTEAVARATAIYERRTPSDESDGGQ